MAKKISVAADGSPPVKSSKSAVLSRTPLRASSLLDTRVIYCGDNLEQLAKLPDACDSAFRTPHSAIALTVSFYYHCDWHASHYVKVLLDQIFGVNNFQNEITAGING
jgi:hypothetical protein